VTPLAEVTPNRSQQRRARQRDANRAAILAAARDLGRSQGWDAVTMRALADHLEYSANFAYRYFAGREDILLGLVRAGFGQLREAMSAAAAAAAAGEGTGPSARTRPSEQAMRAAVHNSGHAYLDFALAEPDLYQLMYGLGGARVPATDAWSDGQAVGDLLIDFLRALGDPDAERHVLQLWATAHGLVALAVVGRVVDGPRMLHAIIDDAIDDVLAHISTPPAPKTGQGAGQ